MGISPGMVASGTLRLKAPLAGLTDHPDPAPEKLVGSSTRRVGPSPWAGLTQRFTVASSERKDLLYGIDHPKVSRKKAKNSSALSDLIKISG
jgi:hypothetical protein